MAQRHVFTLIIAVLMGAITGYAQQPEQLPREACLNQQQWDYAMSLTPPDFNHPQSPSWRLLKSAGGCDRVAADMIETYRTQSTDPAVVDGMRVFQAEMHALAGEYDEALPLYRIERDAELDAGKKLYFEAFIAFLERDREGLEVAFQEMDAIPEPDGFEEMADNFVLRFPDLRRPVWPSQKLAVEAFINCFDKTYWQSLQETCLPPIETPTDSNITEK